MTYRQRIETPEASISPQNVCNLPLVIVTVVLRVGKGGGAI